MCSVAVNVDRTRTREVDPKVTRRPAATEEENRFKAQDRDGRHPIAERRIAARWARNSRVDVRVAGTVLDRTWAVLDGRASRGHR